MCGCVINTPSDTYTYNGRCYATFCPGGAPRTFQAAQNLCIANAGPGSVGRLATFFSASDYVAVAASMPSCSPGPGANGMYIGIRNAGTTPIWEDPPNPPNSCAPAINLTQFATAAGLTPTSFSAVDDTVTLYSSWIVWQASNSAKKYMCEIGKLLMFL